MKLQYNGKFTASVAHSLKLQVRVFEPTDGGALEVLCDGSDAGAKR